MIIAFSSVIGPVPLNVLISEKHTSDVEITSNPIETGAEVNDHAYVKPKEVELEIADANAAMTHAALVAFQESRVPFTLVTGLRVYNNMIIKGIDAERNKTWSKVLKATVRLKEVKIVETGTAEEGTDAKDNGDKNKSSNPSKDKANNAKTADKANGGVNAGDKGGTTVAAPKSQSLLKSTFGGSSPAPSGGGGGGGGAM